MTPGSVWRYPVDFQLVEHRTQPVAMPAISVTHDLLTWGPDSGASPPSRREAEEYCRKLATSHYENFPVVSWFLPRSLHQHFYNVYAYCRWADDLGDEIGDPVQSLSLLHWWQEQLDRCYAGEAVHPVFVALRTTIERFSIPREPFADLLSAFMQDQVVQEYESMPQLLNYCRRSANPVGRIVLYLCERADPENFELSDQICTGLQLANFWQDVSRDLDIGRVYLPAEMRTQFGYRDEDLRQKKTTPEFLALMKELVRDARDRLQRGRPLVKRMPGRLRVDVDLFARGGLLILDAIERSGYRVWEQRPVVTKRQLLVAAMKSLVRWP